MNKATPADIATALGYVPADDRECWLRMGMAVKSELDDAGFAIWNEWSQSSSAYVERDALDVWKSFKNPDGGVTIASLFAEAKANGYQAKPDHNGSEGPKTPEAIWQAGTDNGAGEHPYLKLKGIGAHGVRVNGKTLLLPVRDLDGKLHSVQFVFEDGGKWDKKFRKGTKLNDDHCHVVGNLDSETIVLAEGYGAVASIHEATGYATVLCFGCERLAKVGKAIKARYPKASILIAGDDDRHHQDKNPGRDKALKAGKEIGARVVFPVFASGSGGDFNDLALAEGAEAVKLQIEAALNQGQSDIRRQSVELIHGASIVPKPINWLWDGWLARGKFHVLAGPPGTGKTTIAAALAATVTCGGRWPDGTRADTGNVLIWSGEDDPEDTLQGRLLACGADPSRFWYVGDVKDGEEKLAFDPALHIDALTQTAEQIGNVSFLIVDPIVSAVAGDSHKNAEVRRGLQPLVTLATKLNCAVIGISHFSKSTAGRDPVERVTGSIAFGALARVVFAAAKMPEGDQDGGARLFCRSKSNIGVDDGGFRYDLDVIELDGYPGVIASRLLWGNAETGSARELLGRADAQAADDDQDDDGELPQVTWLRNFLEKGPKPSTECVTEGKAAGFTDKQIRTAREKLRITPARDGFGRGGEWCWSLPEGTFTDDKDAIDASQHSATKQRASKASMTEATDGAGSSDSEKGQKRNGRASMPEASNGAGSSALHGDDSTIDALDALVSGVRKDEGNNADGAAQITMSASKFLGSRRGLL